LGIRAERSSVAVPRLASGTVAGAHTSIYYEKEPEAMQKFLRRPALTAAVELD
jgi:hypothetical protein